MADGNGMNKNPFAAPRAGFTDDFVFGGEKALLKPASSSPRKKKRSSKRGRKRSS